MKKLAILLFGEMGAGKSHFGRQLAERENCLFVEGDDCMPDDMHAVVKKFGVVTDEMTSKLVANLITTLTAMQRCCLGSADGVVLAQALYKERDRVALVEALKAAGYVVEVGWVRAGFLQNVRQLWARDRGLRWVLYWLASKPFFEYPKLTHVEVRNARTDD